MHTNYWNCLKKKYKIQINLRLINQGDWVTSQTFLQKGKNHFTSDFFHMFKKYLKIIPSQNVPERGRGNTSYLIKSSQITTSSHPSTRQTYQGKKSDQYLLWIYMGKLCRKYKQPSIREKLYHNQLGLS